MLTKLLSTSIIVGVFLIGCGGETKEQSSQDVSMPHQVDRSPKNLRDSDPDSEEYLNYMKTYNLNSIRFSGSGAIRLSDYDNQNKNLHYQIFHDNDFNKNTGYVDPWVPNVGAEFLIEDGVLFKYTGTPGSNEWSWEVIDWNRGDIRDREGIKDYFYGNGILYGVTLNQDWSYNKFLGYYNAHPGTEIDKFIIRRYGPVVNTVSEIDDDIYIRSYKAIIKKYEQPKLTTLNKNDKYFSYEFEIGDQIYYTEGNILFKEDGTVIADNLQYEVREYEAITIIPKSLFPNVDFNLVERKNSGFRQFVIRDKDWKMLHYYKLPWLPNNF